MVVSVNYQRLYDFGREFEHRLDFSDAGLDLVQDKQFKQDGFIGALGIAGSIELTPNFSFGLTFNVWTDELFWDNGWEEDYRERATGTQGGVPVTIDTTIDDDYSQFRGVNANFGFLWNIMPALTLGAVLKTPFTATAHHTFSFNQTQTFGSPINDIITSRKTIIEDIELDMPLSYGAGLSWRTSDALTVSADIHRTHWSDYILRDGQGNEFSPIDGQPAGRSDIKDTVQVRMGGEYLFVFPEKRVVVPARAGFFYDPEPGRGSVRDFYGISLGTGISYKKVVIDIAYIYRWGQDIDTGNLVATAQADITQQAVLVSLIYHFN